MANNSTAASVEAEAELVEKMINVKISQLHVKWLKEASEHIHKDNQKDIVYKICCCYHVFSKAAGNYKDIPYAFEIAEYYAHEILCIIEEKTGEKIRELADRINGRENSIPTNLLFWCDVIELHKTELYEAIWGFIYLSIENTVPRILQNPDKKYHCVY